MGIFAMGTRRPTDRPGARGGLSEVERQGVPPHFEAVGESLASGVGRLEACEVAGGDLARSGASLEEVLEGLSATTLLVRGREPEHGETRAAAVAWADVVLAYLHQLSCEDPLTGLASHAHVRGRVADLYRGEVRQGVPTCESHALVMVQAPTPRDRWGRRDRTDGLDDALRVARLGSAARTVFGDGETVGRVGPAQVVVVAGRDRLGPRVGLLRRMLAAEMPAPRVWIEGLPGTDAAAARLLDELARA